MSLLLNRVSFTEWVEQALNGGDLVDVQKTLLGRREKLILSVRGTLAKPVRQQMNTLQTLMKEQLEVVADLMAATDKQAAWKDECRFYAMPDGTVHCQCCDHDVLVGDDFPTKMMLVVTPLTRTARRAYLKAMVEKKILIFAGPAGTGKTETVKDTAAMLGVESCVVNCSEALNVSGIPAQALDAVKRGGPACPLIFDEFNRLTAEAMENTTATCAKENIFVACTLNPLFQGRVEIPDSIKADAVELPFTIPDYTLIVSVMLAAEGFTQCDDLASRLVTATHACKEKCSRQVLYDYGLRHIKAVCRCAGGFGRAAGFANEAQIAVNACAANCIPRAVAEDKNVIKAELIAAFGVEPELPSAWSVGGIQGVASMVADMAQIRHGIVVTGVTDVDACTVAICTTMGAESIVVGGEPGSLHDGGDDSLFATAFRAAMAKQGPVNVIVKGPLGPEQMEPLNTVLDDNKVLCTPSGAKYDMHAGMRVIFFDDCRQWTPASISRCGCVS